MKTHRSETACGLSRFDSGPHETSNTYLRYGKAANCFSIKEAVSVRTMSVKHSIAERAKFLVPVLKRYQEVNSQLRLQRLVFAGYGSESSSDESRVPRIMAWPEHFKRISTRRKLHSGIVPWEGSRYLLVLLSSLSDKLLLKYCYCFWRNLAVTAREKLAASNDIYAERIAGCLSKGWRVLYKNCVSGQQSRALLERALSHHSCITCVRALRRWRKRAIHIRKHCLLEEMVGKWRAISECRAAVERFVVGSKMSRCIVWAKTWRRRRNKRLVLHFWRSRMSRSLKTLCSFELASQLRKERQLRNAMKRWHVVVSKYRDTKLFQSNISTPSVSPSQSKKQSSTTPENLPDMRNMSTPAQQTHAHSYSPLRNRTDISPCLQHDARSSTSTPRQQYVHSCFSPLSNSSHVNTTSYPLEFTYSQLASPFQQLDANSHGSNQTEFPHSSDTDLSLTISDSASAIVGMTWPATTSEISSSSNGGCDGLRDCSSLNVELPIVRASPGTLPLSYVLLQIDRRPSGETKSAIASAEEISIQESSGDGYMSDASSISSPTKLSNISASADECTPKQIELGHSLKSVIDHSPGSIKQRVCNREVDNLRTKCMWRAAVTCLHLWRHRVRIRHLLGRVFGLALNLWEDRLYRARSEFFLLKSVIVSWRGIVEARHEQVALMEKDRKALVFRGITLIARSFVIWTDMVRHHHRLREREWKLRREVLCICWTVWRAEVSATKRQLDAMGRRYKQNMCVRCLQMWRLAVRRTMDRVDATKIKFSRIQLRCLFRQWSLHWRFSAVRRLVYTGECSRYKAVIHAVWNEWSDRLEARIRARQCFGLLEKVLLKFRTKRVFLRWPGRDISLRASEMCRRVVRRRQMASRNRISILGTSDVKERPTKTNPIIDFSKIDSTTSSKCSKVKALVPSDNSVSVQGRCIKRTPSYIAKNSARTNTVIPKLSSKSKPFVAVRRCQSSDPPVVKVKSLQQRAVAYGYSDGFLVARNAVTRFLLLVLQVWRAVVVERKDIRRRGLFLAACSKIRRTSRAFYHWLSRVPAVTHRSIVWIAPTCRGVNDLYTYGTSANAATYTGRSISPVYHKVIRATITDD